MDHFAFFAQARDELAAPGRLPDPRGTLDQQSSALGGLQRGGFVQIAPFWHHRWPVHVDVRFAVVALQPLDVGPARVPEHMRVVTALSQGQLAVYAGLTLL